MLPGIEQAPAGDLPIVISRNSYIASSGSTSHSVPLPSGLVAGNLLLLVHCGNATAANTPAGWTVLTSQQYSTTRRIAVFYKVADGGEGSSVTYTIASSGSPSAFTWQIANWNGVTPTFSTIAGQTGTAPNADEVALDDALPALVLAVCACGISTVSAYPSGYDNTRSNSNGSSTTSAAAEKEMVGASEDPGAFAISASVANAALAIAIQGNQ